MSDRFFTLMAFLHLIGLPIFPAVRDLAAPAAHLAPHGQPRSGLVIGSLAALTVLSLLWAGVSARRRPTSARRR